ncbi:MAG TPA: hypothetical protein VMT24_18160 [Aggregatilineaceae bacterium]|nr:hypothetical protein [Aggregatilineaceae bacterium]
MDSTVYRIQPIERPVVGLVIGGKTLAERDRLEASTEALMALYSGVPLGELLLFPPDRWLPYQMITVQHRIALEEAPYEVRGILRPVCDQVEAALRANPNYRPGLLARIQQVTLVRPARVNRITGPLKPPSDEEQVKVTLLRPVHYSEAMATNLIADVPLSLFGLDEPSTPRLLDRGANGTLRPLEESMLANPIGVAGLAISRDGQILTMHRAKHLSTYADVLGATSSGYVDWSDITAAPGSLNAALLFALRREIGEELYLMPEEIDGIDFVPLGVYREFYRAGFVQAFYGFSLPLSAGELAERLNTHGPHGEFQALVALPRGVDLAALFDQGAMAGVPVGKELQGLLAAARQFRFL